jgi:nucleotide-binding universal stress UspA family protein
MFEKILVCLDGSELAEKVLPYAIEEATRFESELVLFRVVSEPYLIGLALPGMPGVPINAQNTEKRELEEEQEAKDYLKSTADKVLNERKLRMSYDSTIGTPGPAIIEYCEKQNINLIALATHGRSGPGRVILGSIADYVIRHSTLPILLIRPTREKAK